MNRLFENLIARERGELKGLSPRLPYLFEHDAPAEPPLAQAAQTSAPIAGTLQAGETVRTESHAFFEKVALRTQALPASLNVWPSHAPAPTIETAPITHTTHTTMIDTTTVNIAQNTVRAAPQPAAVVSPPAVNHSSHHTVVNTLVTLSPPPAVQSTAKATPSRARKANVPAPQPAALREPDVHITIGRLEVRAPATPAPAPARRPAAAPMSLDQYLNRRNGQEPK